MNESLAARQEALQRQNQELNQQVEAIEQRRQQQLISASSSTTSLRKNFDQQNESKARLETKSSTSTDTSASRRLAEARRKSESKEKMATGVRKNSVKRSQRREKQTEVEASSYDVCHSQTQYDSVDGKSNSVETVQDNASEGLGLEATVRYQKARLRVLQDETDSAAAQIQQLQTTQSALKGEIEGLKADNATLTKKSQQTQQLLDKQRELSAAQEAKQRILEGQLQAAQSRVDEIQRAEKLASQQFRSKDVRLNRALEEVEKLKVQLQDEKRNHGEQMVTKTEYDRVVLDSKKLDKQKGELLAAFKKQMKLIDLLKRQRVHMEAAKMLSFTEAEFSKTLELG